MERGGTGAQLPEGGGDVFEDLASWPALASFVDDLGENEQLQRELAAAAAPDLPLQHSRTMPADLGRNEFMSNQFSSLGPLSQICPAGLSVRCCHGHP